MCSALERKLEETKDRYTTDLQFLQESVTSLHNGLAAAKTSIEVHSKVHGYHTL